MIRDGGALSELADLWEPVYPFLAEHLLATSGIEKGRLLELGPFAGGIALNVLWRSEVFLVTVLAAEEVPLRWAEERAAEGGYVSRLTTRCAPLVPLPEPSGSFDLVVLRGAFFGLTPSLLAEIARVLRPRGFGWVGGGFGPTTPPPVIASIADRSRTLNQALGKRRVERGDLEHLAREAGLHRRARVRDEGGLWLEVRA
ncbi:MAG: class I SAM-dependent methyltransferase [Deltaproteobacteria bacterium]|nr:class I SAM-dependent methyltransferase [Deltaproteobacteria bacterium]